MLIKKIDVWSRKWNRYSTPSQQLQLLSRQSDSACKKMHMQRKNIVPETRSELRTVSPRATGDRR